MHFADAINDVLFAAHGNGALDMTGFVQFGRNQARNAAERFAPADNAGDALFVDTVLQGDYETISGKIGLDELGRPFGVVRLDANESDIDRMLFREALHV